MKKFVSVILAAMLVLYPVSVSAVPQDYDSLLEEYKELKSKYKKLKKKYEALKEQVEGGAPVAEAEAPAAPVSDGGGYVYETSGHTYTYLRSEIANDGSQDYLIVYFHYDNQSGEETMPMMGADIGAYQNYVEMSAFSYFGSGIPELANATTQIRSGGNIDFAYSFELQDMSDVTISLAPLFDFSGAKPYEFLIHLPGLETELLS